MLRPRSMAIQMVLVLAVLLAVLLVPFLAFAESSNHNNEHADETAHHGDDEHGAAGDHHDAQDAHGGHGELHFVDVISDTEFIGNVINFIGLIAILIWLGRKPLGNFLVARRKAIQDGMDEAAKMREAAEAKYKEYSDRLEKLDDEMKRMSEAILQAAQNERERITKEADQRSKRLEEETQRLIEQQMKQLYSDVMHEVVDASVSAAETVLVEKLNANDQKKLARDYLGELAKTAKGEGDA